MNKICSSCGQTKPFGEFGTDNKRHDKLTVYCTECHNAKGRASKRKNREKNLEYNRVYREKNKDAVKLWGKLSYEKNTKLRTKQAKNWRGTKHGCIRVMHLSAKTRAKKKSLEYQFSPEAIEIFLIFQNHKCAVTGIDFDYTYDDEYQYRPFAPSLDRMDNKRGYTFDNVQIVCTIVNKARNEYSMELFDKMCLARVRKLNNG